MFNIPTIVTITGPTCSGKSYLRDELAKHGFNSVISSTDRPPRKGEVDGKHYYFKQREYFTRESDFFELNCFGDYHYGVTLSEMADATTQVKPPLIIVDTKGLETYRRQCAIHKWALFTIFVETNETTRIHRLGKRTATELLQTSLRQEKRTQSLTEREADFYVVTAEHSKRLKIMLEAERSWKATHMWDVIADGTDIAKAVKQIQMGIESRNTRSDIYAFSADNADSTPRRDS